MGVAWETPRMKRRSPQSCNTRSATMGAHGSIAGLLGRIADLIQDWAAAHSIEWDSSSAEAPLQQAATEMAYCETCTIPETMGTSLSHNTHVSRPWLTQHPATRRAPSALQEPDHPCQARDGQEGTSRNCGQHNKPEDQPLASSKHGERVTKPDS